MTNKATLYIDESGKSSLKEQENNPFIMTGVIIDDKEINAIEGYFNYIKRKYGIPPNSPFHSYHIYEDTTTKLSDSQLLELSSTLAEFISLIPAEIRVLEINKQVFRDVLGIESIDDFRGSKERKEMPDFPYRVMSTILFKWFSDYLEGHDVIGQIICDSRRGADHHLLNTLNLCKEGHVPYSDSTVSAKIKKRVSAICFGEKNYLSGGLEITDLISFISYFRVRRLISANQNIGVDKIWSVINKRIDIIPVGEKPIRAFFDLKKGEVHKYLKIN